MRTGLSAQLEERAGAGLRVEPVPSSFLSLACHFAQASQLNWKNGLAQGFAMFSTGAMARAACDTVTQLWWVLKGGGRPGGRLAGGGVPWTGGANGDWEVLTNSGFQV